jgi:hypothetical protein
MDVLHVDCDRCAARGPACDDCVITVLLGVPGSVGLEGSPPGMGRSPAVDLDPAEQAALSALADSGLVPPLRLIPGPLIPGARRVVGVQAPLDWQDYG